jgi:hypothetical protein
VRKVGESGVAALREMSVTAIADPIDLAGVLGPIKAKPFGWPRKTRPALTGPVRGGLAHCGRDGRMLAARVEPKNVSKDENESTGRTQGAFTFGGQNGGCLPNRSSWRGSSSGLGVMDW